jgi:AcrR family transcriptional regulator
MMYYIPHHQGLVVWHLCQLGSDWEQVNTVKYPSTLRRQPVRSRGRIKVNELLRAAIDLVDELGYERVTTTLIAQRAGCSIGSYYQFFADKDGAIAAVVKQEPEYFKQLMRDAGIPEQTITYLVDQRPIEALIVALALTNTP